MNKEALFYEVKNGRVHCHLCPHECIINENKVGICKVRKAIERYGQLILQTENYGEITSLAVDPIEKKPLAQFYPGHMILSIGSFGCNFTCSFCQNHTISQVKAASTYVSPQRLIEILEEVNDEINQNLGVAFTYNEPAIWYEYVYDCAKLIKSIDASLKVVLVTNGFINEKPLKKLLPFIDALNIDLKGDDEYYQKLCTGKLDPVLACIKQCYEAKKHIEITTLLVQDENTNSETIHFFADFIASLSKDIPFHLTRFFPNYKLTMDPTSLDEIKKIYDTITQKLNAVYLGNVTEEEMAYIKGECNL